MDPNRLQAFGLPIKRVMKAVRSGNNDVGGRLVEFGGTGYMVRGRGYASSVSANLNNPGMGIGALVNS